MNFSAVNTNLTYFPIIWSEFVYFFANGLQKITSYIFNCMLLFSLYFVNLMSPFKEGLMSTKWYVYCVYRWRVFVADCTAVAWRQTCRDQRNNSIGYEVICLSVSFFKTNFFRWKSPRSPPSTARLRAYVVSDRKKRMQLLSAHFIYSRGRSTESVNIKFIKCWLFRKLSYR